nr:hypothetical protein [uncultured Sphingomonas sp.]
MMIPNSLIIGLLVFGIFVAALLWSFGLVPWWGALIAIVAAPLAGCAVILILFYALWIASGSH